MPDLPPEKQRIVDAFRSELDKTTERYAQIRATIEAAAPERVRGIAETFDLLGAPNAAAAALIGTAERPDWKAALMGSHDGMVSLPPEPISHDDAALERLIRRVVAEELDRRFGPVGGSDSQEA